MCVSLEMKLPVLPGSQDLADWSWGSDNVLPRPFFYGNCSGTRYDEDDSYDKFLRVAQGETISTMAL